jgi:hypothetical protein
VKLAVGDIDVVAAFARSGGKVGKDPHAAIFAPPNDFPRVDAELPGSSTPRRTPSPADRPRPSVSRRPVCR